MKVLTLCIFLGVLGLKGFSQNDTLSIVSYNLLNFPNGRNDCGSSNINLPNRTDTLRKILGYLKPDIFVGCEIQTQAGADSVLTRSLNVFGATNYEMAPFQYSIGGGGELNNAMYYNSDKLIFLRQNAIQTVSRDINHYTLCAKDPNLFQHRDTVFVEVYMSHLKAGSTAADQAERALQTQVFRAYVDAKPLQRNHLICGDLNVYKSSEVCYQNLTAGGLLPFVDPIATPGNWNNNSSFAAIHTQSSRSSGSYACGSTGGLDDRFDQILTTPNVLSGANRLKYIPNTYKAVGNDGLHFNNSVWGGAANLQYPDSVLRALFYLSDHLPVTLKVVPFLPTNNGLALTYAHNGPICTGNSNGVATVMPLLGVGPFSYAWDSNAGNQNTATASGLTSGSYCVFVTDANGLSDTVCFEIAGVQAISTGVFTTNATGICDGEASIVVNGGMPPYSFLWNDPMAQTTQTAVNLCPGNYTCTISDSSSCSTSVPITIYGPLGAVESILNSAQIDVFPNPMENEIMLMNKANEKLTIDKLTILDMNGTEMGQWSSITLSGNSSFNVKTEFLSKGVYLLRLDGGSHSRYFKVLK